MNVGLVTFDFPPQYTRADVEKRVTVTASPVSRLLAGLGAQVTAPLVSLAARDPGASGGIRGGADSAFCVQALRTAQVDCLVIEVFHWARIALVAELVDQLDVPTAVVAVTEGGWNGVPCAGAVSGSLRESPRTRCAALTESFLLSDEALPRWAAGAAALSRLRRSRLMLWGGSYGAEMPYTRSDPAELERRFVREIMTEQEETLVERARAISSGSHSRITRFLEWLAAHGAAVVRDATMVTDPALDFQVGLYLAARDRLEELSGGLPGEPRGTPAIAAAGIKCHYEMSLTCQGCTACLLPAFLAFGEDAEGPRPVVPFACEGDVNGAVTGALLHALNPAAPPLLGDLVSFRADHLLLRNCGAASVYWAARSPEPSRCLPRVRLAANLHGRSGAAVHFETPAGGPVTFARLYREAGSFRMLVGEGEVLAESDTSRYDDPWPHTRLSLGVPAALLFRGLPCNHGALAEGRLAAELETACAYAGVPVDRCDDEAALGRILERRRSEGG